MVDTIIQESRHQAGATQALEVSVLLCSRWVRGLVSLMVDAAEKHSMISEKKKRLNLTIIKVLNLIAS